MIVCTPIRRVNPDSQVDFLFTLTAKHKQFLILLEILWFCVRINGFGNRMKIDGIYVP